MPPEEKPVSERTNKIIGILEDFKTCGQLDRLVGCRFKDSYPLVGSGPVRRKPSVRAFLRDPRPYLR